MELSEDQKKFMAALDEEFSNRFTADDEVYWDEHTSPLPEPPIIEPWYNKPRRRFDFARRGRGNEHNGRERHDRYNNDRNFRGDSGHSRDFGHHRDRDSSRDRHDRYRNSRESGFNRDSRGGRNWQDSNGASSGYGGRDGGQERNRDYRNRRRDDRYSDSTGHQQYR